MKLITAFKRLHDASFEAKDIKAGFVFKEPIKIILDDLHKSTGKSRVEIVQAAILVFEELHRAERIAEKNNR